MAKDEKDIKELVVIGAGPSALTAAIYTTREDIDTTLYEKGVVGGLAAITDHIDNYPGFAEGVAGLNLAKEMRKQAERFGAKIVLGEVTDIVDEGDCKRLTTTNGDVYAKAVLIATGCDHRKLGVPGEKEFYGRGVHYCATCDGAFYRDKRLAVVGGGNSAVQEALFLTRYASHIDMFVRSTLKASDVLIKELEKHDKITVHLQTTTDEIIGADNKVTSVKVTKEGNPAEFDVDGVFVFIGLVPNTQFLKETAIELDEQGFVVADSANMATAIPGVFASGDVRKGATMQIASASGEGATAALMVRQYLEGRETNLYGDC